jgi:hypothetical protein
VIPKGQRNFPNQVQPRPGTDLSACTGSGVNTSSSKCAGTQNAVSVAIDYRLLKRLDVYGGLMYSQVNGGLASGYLHANNIAPTIGLRLQF